MNRLIKLFTLIVSICVVLSFFGCKQQSKTIKVGLSLATLQEERWVRDKDKMEQVAKHMGVELLVQISNNDQGKQTTQCEQLLTQGVKVLIIAPHDASAASPIVEKAHKQKVTIISYDRLIMNTNPDVYISFDNVKVGELQGDYITKLVPKGSYVILSGAPTDNNAKLFKEGAMKFIQPLIDSGAIKVIADQAVIDWAPANAQKIMENALTACKNKVDAVLAPNDGTAGGCIQALAAQKLAGKVPITGQDMEISAAQRIIEGTQTMTILKDTRLLGEEAVKVAVMMAKGEKWDDRVNGQVNNNTMDVPSILLTPYAIDKANIDKLVIETGYLTKDQVYKK